MCFATTFIVMRGDEIKKLLDQIAQRDEVIARQAAEIIVLKQTIDALCRRIFGKSSEKLGPPPSSNSCSEATSQKKPTPPSPQTQHQRLKSPLTKKPPKRPAPHVSPSTFPSSARSSIRPKSCSILTISAASAKKCANNSASSPPSSFASSLCVANSSSRTTPPPNPSSIRCHLPCKTVASPPPASSPKWSTIDSSATSPTTGKPKCSPAWECTFTAKPSATGRCSPPTGSPSFTEKSNTNIGARFTARSTKPPSDTSNPAAAKRKPATSGRLTFPAEPSSITGTTAATRKV